jgi:hypothetical protein
MKGCIVTLTIGKAYASQFTSLCISNWSLYAKKHNLDLRIIEDSLDREPRAQKRSPAWQKLLILSQEWSSSYDFIIWIDSDVLINTSRAPNILEFAEESRVGIVDSMAFPTKEMYRFQLAEQYELFAKERRRFFYNLDASDYYRNRGIKPTKYSTHVLQTGVFVASPKVHRNLFESIYFNYEDSLGPEGNYEMPAFSFELLENKIWHFLPPEYNLIVRDFLSLFYPAANLSDSSLVNRLLEKLSLRDSILELALDRCFNLSYFTHFAGCQYLMKKVKVN